MKRLFALLLLPFLLLPCLNGCGRKETDLYNESYPDLFDTVCTFYGVFETAGDFSAVSLLVKKELVRLDAMFDGHHKKSDRGVYAVNAAAGITPVRVDEELITLLELALDLAELTDGAVTPTMGAVTSLWKKATEEGVPPSSSGLQEAGQHIDCSVLEINRLAGTVYLNDPKASIDLGAFAKGYAADRIAELLREEKCENYLLDLGGNIYAKGNDPKTGLPFLVGVSHPADPVRALPGAYISGGALVTSGSDQRGFLYEGKNYHHIISPNTLYPAETGLTSVSVLQSSAALADALSTALFVLGEKRGTEILEIVGGEALFVDTTGAHTETNGFSAKKQNKSDTAVFLFLMALLAVVVLLYFYRNSPKKKEETAEKQFENASKKKRLFSKKDLIFFVGSGIALIICLFTIAFSGILQEKPPEAVVRQNGDVICRLSLSEDQLYRVDSQDGYNIIAVERGEVYIYASDCKNSCCIKSGRIHSMSLPSVLVCLPHRLTVSIE